MLRARRQANNTHSPRDSGSPKGVVARVIHCVMELPFVQQFMGEGHLHTSGISGHTRTDVTKMIILEVHIVYVTTASTGRRYGIAKTYTPSTTLPITQLDPPCSSEPTTHDACHLLPVPSCDIGHTVG